MALHRLSRWVDAFERLPRHVRIAALVGVHLLLFTAAYVGAFLLRFDFEVPAEFQPVAAQTLLLVLGIKTAVFGALKMFQGWWKYVSLYDVIALAYALAVSALVVLTAHALWLRPEAFPRSIYLLDFLLSLLLVGGARGGLRLLRETVSAGASPASVRPLLIVGASDLGDLLIREITRTPTLRYQPVAFVDDDPRKQGLRLHGLPVVGPLEELPRLVAEHQIKEVIIALDEDHPPMVRRVVDLCRPLDLSPRILPTVAHSLHGGPTLGHLREVSIEDLLGRDPVELDVDSLGRFLTGRTVLVTGAGGSIGSELCRQISRFSPKSLLMLDSAETPLFEIHRELRPHHREGLIAVVGDVTDATGVERVFQEHRPEIVLHAAAYKHVPLMEDHPCEAVKNNVVGTRHLIDAAGRHQVQTFVLISTDKAVNPTSVMGATKRLTELYLHRQESRFRATRFCAVRFGNVLGSNGSVVPIFRRQIQEGGPVTVTHPEMTRYFMTIPEATQLVLQAAAFHTGDRLFILDMGRPVHIATLARDMIRLSGRTEDQIPIVYTGMRPGEKLFEELSHARENLRRTDHEMIFVADAPGDLSPAFDLRLDELIAAARARDTPRVLRLLEELLPEYKGSRDDSGRPGPPHLRLVP